MPVIRIVLINVRIHTRTDHDHRIGRITDEDQQRGDDQESAGMVILFDHIVRHIDQGGEQQDYGNAGQSELVKEQRNLDTPENENFVNDSHGDQSDHDEFQETHQRDVEFLGVNDEENKWQRRIFKRWTPIARPII